MLNILITNSSHADLPTIVITPTRTATDVAHLPNAITVIDRNAIERQGYSDLRESLDDVAGVSFASAGAGLGSVTTGFMRGTESSHTLVMLDGMPINDPSNTTTFFDFGNELLGSVDRIEVVRGPTSVLYGSQAIGGVINLVTREAKQGNHQEITMSGGSYGRFQGEGIASGHYGKFDYVTGVEGFRNDGINNTPNRFPNNIGDVNNTDTYALFTNVGVQLSDDTKLRAQIHWRDLNTKLDDEARDDPNFFANNQALNWNVKGEHEWLYKQVNTSLMIGRQQTSRNVQNRADAFSALTSSEFIDALYIGERWMVDWQNTVSLPNTSFTKNTKLVGGVDYDYTYTFIDFNSDGLFGPFTQSVSAADNKKGLYGQAQTTFFDRFDVVTGLRRDYPNVYDAKTTVKAGLVIQVPEARSRIRTNIGTAYRTPGLYERFGIDNFGTAGNPNLKPETSVSWEAGVEKDFAAFDKQNFANASVTYFENVTDDLVQYKIGFPASQYENIARVRSKGVESQLGLKPFDWLEGHVTYTWLDAINASGFAAANTPNNEQLLRRPHNKLSASATFWPISEWEITPQMHYTGKRFDVTYDDTGTFVGRALVGGFTTFDLATRYHLNDNATLFAKAENIFDRTIEDPNGYRKQGLNIRAGFTYKFGE